MDPPSLAWPDPIPHRGKGLGHGHRAVCCPAPWSVYQSQHSIQSHETWSMWLTWKFKISVWVEREFEAWEVRWARSVLSHELEHSRNQNRRCRKVASLISAIAIVTSWPDLHWLIKFLGDKLLYGHIPDPFPRCRIGSDHTRLTTRWGTGWREKWPTGRKTNHTTQQPRWVSDKYLYRFAGVFNCRSDSVGHFVGVFHSWTGSTGHSWTVFHS